MIKNDNSSIRGMIPIVNRKLSMMSSIPHHNDTKLSMILRMKHFQVSMPHYDVFQAFMIHFKYLRYIRCMCDTFWYFSSICDVFDDTNHISSIRNTFKHLWYDTFYTLCQTFIMPSCHQFVTFLPLCHQQKGNGQSS